MARDSKNSNKEVTDAQIVKAIKSAGSDYSEAAIAKDLGITPAALGGRHFRLEAEAIPSLRITSSGKTRAKEIKRLRDNEGVRWERLAGRSGISVAEAKQAYRDAGGDPDKSYTGRGRDYTGTARKSNGGSSGRRGGAASKKTASGASGRRAAGRGAAKKTATTGRAAGRRTRAERAAANPS